MVKLGATKKSSDPMFIVSFTFADSEHEDGLGGSDKVSLLSDPVSTSSGLAENTIGSPSGICVLHTSPGWPSMKTKILKIEDRMMVKPITRNAVLAAN